VAAGLTDPRKDAEHKRFIARRIDGQENGFLMLKCGECCSRAASAAGCNNLIHVVTASRAGSTARECLPHAHTHRIGRDRMTDGSDGSVCDVKRKQYSVFRYC